MTELEFKQCCEQKLKFIRSLKSNNIWIFGAGKGAEVLYEILEKDGIDICGFLDKRASDLKSKYGFPVKQINDFEGKNPFIIVSLMEFSYEALVEISSMGILPNQVLFIATHKRNAKTIEYLGAKIGKFSYDYVSFMSRFPHLLKEMGAFCSISETARCIAMFHNPADVTTHIFRPVNEYTDYLLYDEFEEWRSITIGNDVWIGYNALIMPNIKVGDGAIIGAGAVVTHDVPDHCLVAGNPARIIRRGMVLSDRGQILERGEKVKQQV